ncbi:sensor histidine kinase [Listeria riparia]|uniref:Autoinducer sensor protein n=1 Tax=Listeria riparia FSL S10-1204 TaxID=1265816 RepID=W7CSV6_9LIST|nr:GHKL domain-containing protein [Listeria riparia]EUJ42764.1 autoinducer sensor protein [Listeria riparia FSL S10-1204]
MSENTLFVMMFLIHFILPVLILRIEKVTQVLLVSLLLVYFATNYVFFGSFFPVYLSILSYGFLILSLYMVTNDTLVSLMYFLTINLILNVSWYCSFGILLSVLGQDGVVFPFAGLSSKEITLGYIVQFLIIVLQSLFLRKYLNQVNIEIMRNLMDNSLWLKIVMLGLPVSIELVTSLFLVIPEMEYHHLRMGALVIVFLMIYLVGMLALKIKISQQKAYLALTTMQQERLERQNKSLKGLKHDFNNILISIHFYLQKSDYRGLGEYMQDIGMMMDDDISLDLPEIRNTPIKGLLLAKLFQARAGGVQVNIEATEIIDQIPVSTAKCVRILGIILDNAIEAALESEEATVDILMYSQNKRLYFLVMNTMKRGCDLDIEAIYEPGYSSKGSERGYGLYNLYQLVKSEKKLAFQSSIVNGSFVAKFSIIENIRGSEAHEKTVCH